MILCNNNTASNVTKVSYVVGKQTLAEVGAVPLKCREDDAVSPAADSDTHSCPATIANIQQLNTLAN